MSWVSGKQSYKSAGEHPAWCDGDMIQKKSRNMLPQTKSWVASLIQGIFLDLSQATVAVCLP